MKALLIALPLILVLSGCMTVLGYEPTPAELEMIKRGEDPRANEDNETERTGGESSVDNEPVEEQPIFEVDQSIGPTSGIVLRWVDSETVIVEADSKREVVLIANPTADLEDLMDTYTYGTEVTLTYPQRDERGEVIYRDDQGRLLANIK